MPASSTCTTSATNASTPAIPSVTASRRTLKCSLTYILTGGTFLLGACSPAPSNLDASALPTTPLPGDQFSAAAGLPHTLNAEQLYLACAREAAEHGIRVKPFPSTQASAKNGGKERKADADAPAIDVMDMSVENGCEARPGTARNTAPGSTQPFSAYQEIREIRDSGKRLKITQQMPAERLQVELGEQTPMADGARNKADETMMDGSKPLKNAPNAPRWACSAGRDMSMQSHFMLLNLCLHDTTPAQAEAQTQSYNPQHKKKTRVIMRLAT
ncbi:hypothetical protein PQR62_10835 [Herbaspirillum lusitanum]|uniref:Lipoprotein n=1 Tax=Herbaspirillum lusitanum TaxID=213312 RepID=A0ABW9A9W1_9BURK